MARNVKVIQAPKMVAWRSDRPFSTTELFAELPMIVSAKNECTVPAERADVQISLYNPSGTTIYGGNLAQYTGYNYYDPGIPAGSTKELSFLGLGILPPKAWYTTDANGNMNWKSGYPLRVARVLNCRLIFNKDGHAPSYGGTPDDPYTSNYFDVGTYVLDRFYNPRIVEFGVERYDADLGKASDTGNRIAITIRGNVDASGAPFTLKLYYAQGSTVTTSSVSIDLTSQISAMLSSGGIQKSTTLIARTFDAATDWSFLLVYGDAYESARAYDGIGMAWANVHYSGLSTGGVRFGGFCKRSALNHPAFECDYPIYADGGIENMRYSTDEVRTAATWIDGKPVYRRVFQMAVTQQTTTYEFPDAIDDLGTVVSIQGTFENAGGIFPLTYAQKDGSGLYSGFLYLNTATKKLSALFSTTFNIKTITAIVEYTKA